MRAGTEVSASELRTILRFLLRRLKYPKGVRCLIYGELRQMPVVTP